MYEDNDFWPVKCPECREEFVEKIWMHEGRGAIALPQLLPQSPAPTRMLFGLG